MIGNAYWNEIAPRENFLNLIARTYAAPNESRGYNSFPDLDASDGADFYQAVQAKREAILNEPGRALSNEQKAYWSGMAGKIDTPLQYGYYEGWEVIISSFGLLLFAVLAICIVIAPVFFRRISGGNRRGDLIRKIRKNKTDHGQACGLPAVWNHCICLSYGDRLHNTACGVSACRAGICRCRSQIRQFRIR